MSLRKPSAEERRRAWSDETAAELERVVLEHLPAAGSDATVDAFLIQRAAAAEEPGVWNPAEEMKKIAKLDSAVACLAASFARLHPDLQSGVLWPRFPGGDSRGVVRSLAALQDVLRPAVEEAKRAAVRGHHPGKSNRRAARVAESCREVWQRRTGLKAAESASDSRAKPTPFEAFVRAVFDCEGIGLVRSKLRPALDKAAELRE